MYIICGMDNFLQMPVCFFKNLPELNKTIAFKQLYSAESTWRIFNFSTCSWKIRMWSMKATTLSAAIGDAWSPAAASKGATCRGIEHCAAFSTKSSLQLSLRRATWSVICKSGKNGIFLAHSTALNKSLAANSQIFSIPMILLGCMHCPYLDVGYGSALRSIEIKLDKYVCPVKGSPFVKAICPGNGCWVGGILPLWTAEMKRKYFTKYSRLSLSRTRLSRITAYLEVIIWSLF